MIATLNLSAYCWRVSNQTSNQTQTRNKRLLQMRLLVSALSCNPSLGSEALVGFKYAEALSRRYETVIIAAAPSQAPEGAALLTLNAGQCSFNEVSAGPLLHFELRQQRIARRLRNQFPFDYVH